MSLNIRITQFYYTNLPYVFTANNIIYCNVMSFHDSQNYYKKKLVTKNSPITQLHMRSLHYKLKCHGVILSHTGITSTRTRLELV